MKGHFYLNTGKPLPRPDNLRRVSINFREYGMTEANATDFLRVFRAGLISIRAYYDTSWGGGIPLNCEELTYPAVRGNNFQATIELTLEQQRALLGVVEGFDTVVPFLMDMAKDIQDGEVKGHFVKEGTKGRRICPSCNKNRNSSSFCGNERVCQQCHKEAVMNG